MSKFWKFKSIGETTGELMLYGDIRSQKPWWNDEDEENIYPRQFAADLKALGNVSQLTVRINSMGGDVFAANSIYTQLKEHPANVTVKIDGIAASAATIIAMAGDTIQAPSNAMLMIHDPLLGLYGYYNSEDMKKMSNVLETVKESIINAYVNKTGRDRSELSDMMKQETWMTADQANTEGFVDEILFEDSIEASATNDGRYWVVNSVLHDLSRFQTRPNKNPVNKAPVTKQPVMKKESEEKLDIKNLEELKQQYPDLCNQFEKEVMNKERDRLKAIDEIAQTVPEDLVNKAKYETPMTAQDLAFEALKADAAPGKTFSSARAQELNPANQVPAAPQPQGNEEEEDILNKIAAAANQKRNKEAR